MALSEELQQRVEQSRRELLALSAEENLAVAAFVRDSKRVLETERQRELAEDIAFGFEQRAAEVQASDSSAREIPNSRLSSS